MNSKRSKKKIKASATKQRQAGKTGLTSDLANMGLSSVSKKSKKISKSKDNSKKSISKFQWAFYDRVTMIYLLRVLLI